MARYNYVAKVNPQKEISGDIEAASVQEAIDNLTAKGYFPISVEESGAGLQARGRVKISNREVASFTTQLAELVDSGVNILSGLNIISNQTANKYLKAIIDDVIGRVKDGMSLSESLALHPQAFSGLYSSLVRTGEAGGSLKETLKRMSSFLEKEEEFKNTLKASLTYPAFIFIVGTLTVVVLLVFVIPRLVGMFEDMGQALPLPTLILINTSQFLRNYFVLIIAGTGMGVFLSRRYARTPQGKLFFDILKLKIIVLGQVNLKSEISRLMRTLSLLFASGVPITSSLDIASATLENSVLKAEVQGFVKEISQGKSLSSALKNSRFFPGFVHNIVAIGEETGSLADSLMRIANTYEKEVDRALKEMTRLLEPVIILIMGLIVGFIVLSMLLPIFQINLMVR